MPATIAGSHLGPDIHANRPAANAAGQPVGALYSCTTHSLIYITDGATWTTYATLGTAGAYVAGGTDVAVADGGTGASTAAGAATNLGLGTGDSPQFTAVNIGAATDTTLARVSAGVLEVEGNRIFAVGGADVPIADGGTGASTATAAFDALSPMTTAGDLIVGGSAGTRTRLAKGADGDVLTVDPTTHLLVWAAPAAWSGDVATDVIWNAKGDLAVGTGSDTAIRRAVGSNGQVLTADSAETDGVKWASPSGGGLSGYDAYLSSLSGLVHRWKFEEVSGDFADSVGSLTLVKSGTVTYGVAGGPVSGAAGSATFGAAAKGVSSGLGSLPTGQNPRTFVCVFKPALSTAKQCLWSYGNAGTRQWWTQFLNDGDQDTWSVTVYGDDLNFGYSASSLYMRPNTVDGEWHFGIAAYNGRNTTYFMYDMLFGKRTVTALSTTASGNLQIGLDTTNANQFAGTFDDIAVFDRCLEPWEMQQLAMRFGL